MNIWLGMMETKYWIFQYIDGKVVAYSKVIYVQQNAFGATTGGTEAYFNDKTEKKVTWYWNVRNALAQICNNKITFIESKKN